MEFLREHLSKFIVGAVFIGLSVFYYKSTSVNNKSENKKEAVNFNVSSDSNNKQNINNSDAAQKTNSEKSDSCSVEDIEAKSKSANGLDASAMDEEKIKSIVKDYIENNPEIIISSLERYQKDKEVDLDGESQKRILEKKDVIDAIKKDTTSYIGNKDSNRTIIMFLDYNCDYCKRAGSIMRELVELDPKVKVVIQQYPILGNNSSVIAKIVAYVSKNSPDKFLQTHEQMLALKNPTEQDLREYVFKNNIGNFDEIMENQDTINIIENSKNLGGYLGVQGVPGFIIQDRLIPGLISIEQIRELVKDKDSETSTQ
jgi:protein-disulfide isomerase